MTLRYLALSLAAVPALGPPALAQDTTPPAIVSVAVDPAEADVSDGPATIAVEALVRDEESGIERVVFGFSPLGGSSSYGRTPDRVEGDATEGTYRATFTLPQYASGTWSVYVAATDSAGQRTVLRGDADGGPAVAATSDPADAGPGTLTDFALSATTVDVGAGPVTLALTARATDDLAGYGAITVLLRPAEGPRLQASLRLTEGTRTDGVFEGTAVFPEDAALGEYEIRVLMVDGVLSTRWYNTPDLDAAGFPSSVTVTATAVAGEDAPEAQPAVWLADARPNPARRGTHLRFGLDASGPVRLVVYDAVGREGAVLLDGTRAAGEHEVWLDATGLAPGVYVVRLVGAGGAATRTVTVVR